MKCSPSRNEHYVQSTTWKDQKQAMLIHTTCTGSSRGMHNDLRSKRGYGDREVFPAPQAQQDYSLHFAAVEQNDRDSGNYTTSMQCFDY